mgnify:CR=1 FL=1
MKPTATAVWQGTGKTGKGSLTTGSKALSNAQYTFKTRFGSDPGTNPEELIAAAHAGCFTMKLAFVLDEAGFTPDKLETKCEITFEDGTIKNSDLTVDAVIPNISKEKFDEAVKQAEQTCPVSNVLKAQISAKGNLK